MTAEFLHLLGDPAHWMFEIVADAAFAAVGFALGRVKLAHWIDKHNKEHDHD